MTYLIFGFVSEGHHKLGLVGIIALVDYVFAGLLYSLFVNTFFQDFCAASVPKVAYVGLFHNKLILIYVFTRT